MADFDPEAYLTTEVAPPPEVPIITDELRPTTYGPGSPNPTPADLKEYIGNANNPLQSGDVALPRDIADKYGLKTGDPFIYQGKTWHYSDTPNPRVGNVIDVYHPSGEFNPHEYITPPQPSGLPSGVEHGTSGGPEFNPQAYLEPVPSEAPEPTQEPRSPIQIAPGEAPSIPQVTTNVPQFIPQQIGGARAIPQPLPIGGIPRPPQPSPSGPPSPPTQGPGAIGQFMALPPVLSPQQARTGLDTALALAAPQASQQLSNLQQIVPGAAPVVEGVKNSLANTVSSVTAPGTMTLAPALAIPGVAEAWGAYQIAKTPQAMANVVDVIKRYGIASKESASAITDEATRLAMAGTALRKPIMAVSREIQGVDPFAGQVNQPPPSTTFARGRIERAAQAGGVPLSSGTERVLPEGGVKSSKVMPGPYWRVGEVSKEAMEKTYALANSRSSAKLLASTRALYVIGKLNAEQIADLGDYLVSERLMTVNPEHPQILDRAEANRIANDPKIAAAIERYAKVVKPEVEALRLKAGLKASAAEGKSRTFVSLVPMSEELLPEAIPPSAGTLAAMGKTTVFARHAEGYAKEYETNLAKILDRSYTEVMPKARLFDTYESLKKNNLLSQQRVDEIKGQPAVKHHWNIPGQEANDRLPDFSYMPHQISDGVRDATERAPNITSPILDQANLWQRFATSAALTANPPAIINHMRRQFGVNLRTPDQSIPLDVKVLQNVVLPYFGPRAATAERIFTRNASTPEFKQIMQDITDAGGGSTRAFAKYLPKGWIAGTKLGQWQQYNHELLFGVPEGEGVHGFDWRLRVDGEINRRIAEPDKANDPTRMREHANRLGDYSESPDKLVQVVRKIQPFAATTLKIRESEIRSLFGGSGLQPKTGQAAAKLRAETILKGVGGTLMTMLAANKIMSGHWNWQNKPGNEFKLETWMHDAKGNPITVDGRFVDPGIDRVLKTFSIPNLVEEYRGTKGTSKQPNYVGAATVGPTNAASSILNSPLSEALLYLGLQGQVPYLIKPPGQGVPHLLDLAKRGPTSDRGLNTLLGAIARINPVGQAALDYGPKLFQNYVQQQPPPVAPSNVVRAHVVRPNVVKANVVRAKVRR